MVVDLIAEEKIKKRKYNREYMRNYMRNPAHKKKKAIWDKNYKVRNRERVNELANKYYKKKRREYYCRMIARKKIPIPEDFLCEVCKVNNAVQRHHEDYSKPLEVKLLCVQCHNKTKK